MSEVSIASLLFLVMIIFSCFRKGADIFSPGRVFGMVWTIAFGLTDLKLSGFQHDWNVESWLQVLLGPFSFLSGIFVVYVLSVNRVLLPISQMRTISRSAVH
ncbi:MAG: hypothetical protein ABI623_07820, partial [bacterium]